MDMKIRMMMLSLPMLLSVASMSNADIVVKQENLMKSIPTVTSKQLKEAKEAIEELKYADIWRSPRTLINKSKVRIDMQGEVRGGSKNLQIQLNNVRGKSTIATVIVDKKLGAVDSSKEKDIEDKVHNALSNSLSTGNIYLVTDN